MINHPTTELLSDEALAEIEARSKKYKDFADRAATPGDEKVVRWFAKQVAALCQTVRALRTSFDISEAARGHDAECYRELLRTKEAENAALRDQITHRTIELENESRETQKWNNRANQLAIEGQELRQHVAQLTRERDDYLRQLVEAKAETVEKLAQVEKERSDLQGRLAAEVANRVNVNVAKMEESQKTTQAELKRLVDDRPTDTCRGSYEG